MPVIPAISAASVFDSVGLNTHIDFNNWGYQDLGKTIAAINYLGIKHLRDCPNAASNLTGPRSWKTVADGTGAKFLAFIGETSPGSAQGQLDHFAPLAAQGILEGVEGPNEWDVAYSVSQGATLSLAAAFLQKVQAVGKTLNLPVTNISFGAGWVPPLYEGHYPSQGDLSQWCDFGNAHTYPNVGQSCVASISRLNGLAKMAAASRPVMVTEIGFNGSQFKSDADVARFVLFCILDAVKAGNPRLYFYALFNDISGNFGLMNQDGSPKPQGTAIRNLMALLADSGTVTPGALDFTLQTSSANDKTLLMQKSDGTFLLAVWNETDPPHSVTLSLASAAKGLALVDPMGGNHIPSSNLQTYTVTVPDHPVLLEIATAAVVAPPPVVIPPVVIPPVVVPPVVPPIAAQTPSLTHPVSFSGTAGQDCLLAGIVIVDPWAANHAGTMTLNLETTFGTLSARTVAGRLVGGSSAPAMQVKGKLAELNIILGTLILFSSKRGSAKVSVDIWNQGGKHCKVTIPVSVVAGP
jgi:hypothetical protein